MTDTTARNAELAVRYGTPLYVYDLDRALAARQALRAALPEEFELFYSFKANPHPDLARALGEHTGNGAGDGNGAGNGAGNGDGKGNGRGTGNGDGKGDGPGDGCRAEVSSTGELANALAAGFDPARTLYTGPGKTAEEIGQALAAGVRTFSVESPGDLARVGAVARGQGVVADCLLRINAATSAATTSIRMTGAPSQFGFDSETLKPLMGELLGMAGTRVVGAHFFPLSNARDEESLIAEFRASITTAAELHRELGLPIDFLDIGGGFAAPYTVPGDLPVYAKLRPELQRRLDVSFPGWRAGTPRIACESGRYLAGSSGELVTAVTNVKRSRGRTFVILDAGINTIGGMAGLGRLLPLAVKPEDAAAAGGGASEGGGASTGGDAAAWGAVGGDDGSARVGGASAGGGRVGGASAGGGRGGGGSAGGGDGSAGGDGGDGGDGGGGRGGAGPGDGPAVRPGQTGQPSQGLPYQIGQAPREKVSLAGPLCTPGDLLGRNVDVPALAPGDLVTVPNVGAYGPTASLLAFLGRPAPVEVVVRGGAVVSASRLEVQRSYRDVN
jgi:diaminopimelate decarboxylase